MIAKETITEVLQRVSIVDLISESVQLRRAGRGFVGLCPFHNERSGSFNVRADEGYYHCFGCGASGNAISFIMESKGLSFPEAVTDLCERFNIEIKTTSKKATPGANQKQLYRVNELAVQYFCETLHSTPKALSYLQERGVKEESLHYFALGYSGDNFRGLADWLKDRRVPEELLLTLGVCRRSERGSIYDLFRSRIMFPIFIDAQKVGGFGGRILPLAIAPGDSPPKYVNSPESPIYEKSKVLFGFPQALSSIRQSKQVVVVEGYLDVIGLQQAGVNNAVASCGTALTSEHLKRLARLCQDVILLFDGDDAGRAAAAKVFPAAVAAEANCKVLFLPQGDDPDTYALKHGEKTADQLWNLPSLTPLEAFIRQRTLQLGQSNEPHRLPPTLKGKLAQEIVQSVRPLENAVARSSYFDQTAALLRISLGELEKLAAQDENKPQVSVPAGQNKEQEAPMSTQLSQPERELLRAVMAYREQLPQMVITDSELCAQLSAEFLSFTQALHEIQSAEIPEILKKERVRTLLTASGPSWIQLWKEAFKLRGDNTNTALDEIVETFKKNLRRNRLAQQVTDLTEQLLAASSDEEKILLAQEKIAVERLLKCA